MVVVSHGGVIRAALAHALRIHAETALHFSIQNLALSVIERLPEGWRIVTVNELPMPVPAASDRVGETPAWAAQDAEPPAMVAPDFRIC